MKERNDAESSSEAILNEQEQGLQIVTEGNDKE